MLNVLAKTFMTATRSEPRNHWKNHTRFDDRHQAQLFPHAVGGRRD